MKLSINQDPHGIEALVAARHHDPHAILGRHVEKDMVVLRIFRPGATRLLVETRGGPRPMKRVSDSGLFQWHGPAAALPPNPVIIQRHEDNTEFSFVDPYSFPPQVDRHQLESFSRGESFHAYQLLGAHCEERNGIDGVCFRVWAPNAERVSVVGDFNDWDGRLYPMKNLGASGIWELFIPAIASGSLYKYEIRNRQTGKLYLKADPYARRYELRPQTASVVTRDVAFNWTDEQWMQQRGRHDWLHEPLSIYEVHFGSWREGGAGDGPGRFPNYRHMAAPLVDYVKKMGFTHIQLMPVTEHPFDGSWGYQVTGYFAPTSRYGGMQDLCYFIDYCHRHGVGVLLDWVPGHFPKDEHGLRQFDGTPLYEHEDPLRGEHKDWGTLVFNFGRAEVKSFLLSSACYWLSQLHFDGLRVDAVASILYLDYSRQPGEWIPNRYGGNENIEGVEFLRDLNILVHRQFPGALTMAEESTAWPMVSRPVYLGGLGFSLKWNMGWMNDTLSYMQHDPVHRRYNHDKLTFSLLYAFSENFILPLSHDEVVHGKKSLLHKMPGDRWQQFANLRLLYVYFFTHPGSKLLFMGNEFAQHSEWDHDRPLSWELMDTPDHGGVQQLVVDLNRLYTSHPALHRYDFDAQGFQWLDCHDSEQSVLSFARRGGHRILVVVLNFTPVPRNEYRVPVPEPGLYRVILNSDACVYGGSNYQDPRHANDREFEARAQPYLDQPCSLSVTLPPLAGIVLQADTD